MHTSQLHNCWKVLSVRNVCKFSSLVSSSVQVNTNDGFHYLSENIINTHALSLLDGGIMVHVHVCHCPFVPAKSCTVHQNVSLHSRDPFSFVSKIVLYYQKRRDRCIIFIFVRIQRLFKHAFLNCFTCNRLKLVVLSI